MVEVTPGVCWVEIPEADLRILCGCPADSVKHLMRRGLIAPTTVNGVACETGPNAILLSEVAVQNGTFCNLAEFPVLQMLYRQGMILPGHPNNVGRKPLLIGRREVVMTQMRYIHRGNYGLISQEELIAAGLDAEQAAEMMRLKLRFAFGRIQDPRELLDSVVLADNGAAAQLAPGVTVRRAGLNRFEFVYRGERVTVDLNLPPFEVHECPYPLGAFQFRREYFAVVHSGEGDGWDIRRPTMGSIIVYQGRIYLVDAGPNLAYALTALGIGVNEIEGIFHTHSHDDHFAGLTTLIQADHRIKYFAAPLVRSAVMKKLSALLGLDESDFFEYFDVVDLEVEKWNDIDGLEVRPVISPHPVETTIFFFRTLAEGGSHTYAHLADIVGLRTLEGMVTADPHQPGVSRAWFERVRESYLEPADLKKVDIGGGLIHGDAADFRHDRSAKIVLAHTASRLSDEQKAIGSGTSFGSVDVLVPSHRNFVWRSAFSFLQSYFPSVPSNYIHALMNGPIRSFNPETILLKEGQTHDMVYLLLTGVVEMLTVQAAFPRVLSAGAIIGEITGLLDSPGKSTYRAVSFVQALEIPCDLYLAFVRRHDLLPEISRLTERRTFLRNTWLCSGIMSNSTLNAIGKAMKIRELPPGTEVTPHRHAIGMVKSGALQRRLAGTEVEALGPGDFFGEEVAVFGTPALTTLVTTEQSEVLFIPAEVLQAIPNVRWKLFESFDRRTHLRIATSLAARVLLDWHEDYRINIAILDRQHQSLLESANGLVQAIAEGAEDEVIDQALDRLFRLSEEHFAEEERLLNGSGYGAADAHSAKHRALLKQLREMAKDYRAGSIPDTELLAFLHKCAVNHVLVEDRKIGTFLNGKGIY